MIPRQMSFAQIEAAILDGRLSVSGGKGDSTIKSAEKNSLTFQNSLMSAFTQQLGQQSQILNFINGKMNGQIANPQGFTPQTMAAMNTQATEGVANEFNQAQTAAKEAIAQQGGNGLPSGVQAQISGQNTNAATQTEAAAQNQIQLANAQQQQQNYWNAVGVLGGSASMLNPASYAGASNSAGEAVAAEGNAYANSQQTGFFNTFTNSFAKGLGSALSGGWGGLKGMAGKG